MDPRDSKNLVQQAGTGDRDALDQLFARSLPRLRRLLALKAGRALQGNELDDLVQESYLEATRQFASYTYQGPDSFFRWLATVAQNRLANLQRMAAAQKRDVRREVPLAGGGSTIVPGAVDPRDLGPGPRTLTVGVEQAGKLDAALAQLSPIDREVIALSRVQGLSLQEIAEQLGRTRNAVALLLSRALRKLKALLDDAQPE
ncbi:MAG: sigma-70 family RNA polymerase sigma factor [Planctomycetes bacterium]|nr:sigma-70 family RNA polymerase sigma factor [Planctomycetota bacterium]